MGIMVFIFCLSVIKGAVEVSLISGVFALVFAAGTAYLGYEAFCETSDIRELKSK